MQSDRNDFQPISFIRNTLLLISLMTLLVISSSLVGCFNTEKCKSGECEGNDGKCYGCSGADKCTNAPSGNCSSPVAGIYCCTGSTSSGGTGGTAYCTPGNTYNYSSQKCCPNSAPYYYPGTHGISAAGCYSSCPYVGDCGTRFTKYCFVIYSS